jgi:hypothetical protein
MNLLVSGLAGELTPTHFIALPAGESDENTLSTSIIMLIYIKMPFNRLNTKFIVS